MIKNRKFWLVVIAIIIIASVALVIYQAIINQKRSAILDVKVAPQAASRYR
jgi:hypothetical protein